MWRVRAGQPGRVDRLAYALHPALGVGDRALVFAPVGGRGQHDVGELRGRGQEDVLDDEVVQPFQEVPGMAGVGLGLGRVLADAVQRPQPAGLHRLEHLGQVHPRLRRDRRAPHGLEARPRLGVTEVVAAGQLRRDRAHVAAALHVVLPTQRDKARAVAADVPREERQVDQREHVVGSVVVLGDAQRPADLGPVGAAVGVRQFADQLGRDAGDLLGPLERVRLDRRAVVLESGGRPADERLVDQPGVDDLPADRVGQRDVGADVEAEPRVGPLRRGRAPRVHAVHPRAGLQSLQHVVEEDRVCFTRVGAPEHEQVSCSASSYAEVPPPAPKQSSDRRQKERVKCGCRSRRCCCPSPPGRTSGRRSSSRWWPSNS